MIAGWAAKEDWVLPRLLRRRAGERPGAEFLRIEDGPAETFGQVLAAAERIAGQLAGLGWPGATWCHCWPRPRRRRCTPGSG
jgi:hypothetical protein